MNRDIAGILLKLSGEALGGEAGVGICPEAIHDMARQIGECASSASRSSSSSVAAIFFAA